MAVVGVVMVTGVDGGEFRGRERMNRATAVRAAIEIGIVMDDGYAVAREADIELEPIGTRLHAAIERRDRVFGAECAPAAVRVDERIRGNDAGRDGDSHAFRIAGDYTDLRTSAAWGAARATGDCIRERAGFAGAWRMPALDAIPRAR
jgi:hypothetical protein